MPELRRWRTSGRRPDIARTLFRGRLWSWGLFFFYNRCA
jgi:hypothetical protein